MTFKIISSSLPHKFGIKKIFYFPTEVHTTDVTNNREERPISSTKTGINMNIRQMNPVS